MTISLYAIGRAEIEVGKYGMTLEEAKAAFLKTCEDLNIKPQKIKKGGNKIVIYLPFADKNHDLLNQVADVEDLHGDPPNRYVLESEADVPQGGYVKTGTYND